MRKIGLFTLGATLLAAALLWATISGAEENEKGTLLLKVGGGILPNKLPRSQRAPIKVLMQASITTTDKSVPPELKQIVLDINKNGVLQTDHLPTCSLSELESASGPAARQACGGALVGHGNVSSRIDLPGPGVFASNGTLQAFNARINGRQAIFAQVTSERPLPLTYVLRFEVRKGSGPYGTKLIGTVPPIASGYGEITSIDFALKRIYSENGHPMSVLSADCPAPKEVHEVSFPFAKTSFSFANGIHMTTPLTRQCSVRR